MGDITQVADEKEILIQKILRWAKKQQQAELEGTEGDA